MPVYLGKEPESRRTSCSSLNLDGFRWNEICQNSGGKSLCDIRNRVYADKGTESKSDFINHY